MMLRLVALWLLCVVATAAGQEADDGDVDAATAEERGFDYWFGRDVTADAAEAARWFERAAAAERPVALYFLGGQYQRGTGVPQDPARAFELYRRAAELGIANAQAALGNAYLFEGSPVGRDLSAARLWLEAASAQGHGSALYLLGMMYIRGDGVSRDVELGQRFMLRAAELGHPGAAGLASTPLMYGPEARRNVPRGLQLVQRSAAAGDPYGAYLLGWEYMSALHLPRDLGLAVQRFTQAVEGNYTVAALWLAELYARGLGVEIDAARAAELREQGFASAPPSAKNSFAWDLATSPDPVLRNGDYAVVIMEELTADPALRTPAYLDTLAAAYAESTRFDDAVRAQQAAIAALPTETTPAVRLGYDERLALYERREPYRQQ